MRIENPYHEGELRVQERVGELDQGRRNGKVVADTIPRGAIPFVARQPLAVAGSRDSRCDVWASVLVGEPGYLTAPDERTIEMDLARSAVNRRDPWARNIERDGDVASPFNPSRR